MPDVTDQLIKNYNNYYKRSYEYVVIIRLKHKLKGIETLLLMPNAMLTSKIVLLQHQYTINLEELLFILEDKYDERKLPYDPKKTAKELANKWLNDADFRKEIGEIEIGLEYEDVVPEPSGRTKETTPKMKKIIEKDLAVIAILKAKFPNEALFTELPPHLAWNQYDEDDIANYPTMTMARITQLRNLENVKKLPYEDDFVKEAKKNIEIYTEVVKEWENK